MPKIMKFPKDMYYTDPDVPLYEANKEYSVADNMVDRWIKRGGEVVEPKAAVKAVTKTPEVVAPLPVPQEQNSLNDLDEEFDEEDHEEHSEHEGKKVVKTVNKKVVKKKSHR